VRRFGAGIVLSEGGLRCAGTLRVLARVSAAQEAAGVNENGQRLCLYPRKVRGTAMARRGGSVRCREQKTGVRKGA